MPRARLIAVLLLLLLVTSSASAADEVVMLPIAAALRAPPAQEKLGDSVKFYFGTQPSGHVVQNFGKFVANHKTNGFAKTEGAACEWAFISALLSLQERALSVGANAVVNIESYYKKRERPSQTEFECHKGFVIAGVALRGDVVRLADR